ncbi:MAG: DnaA regulatory inactivator Hda [Gammaproteobacteria bacterium]|nr:DnaA regulatory inactivator Hda [Gammaproteobacteria bacterium]
MQLLLPVTINSSQTFESFVGEDSAQIKSELLQSIKGNDFKCFFLAGGIATGKTHLLSACCQAAAQNNKTSILVPLEQVVMSSPDIVDGIEDMSVVCLDNIEEIIGKPEWQVAIFNLFNALIANNATLVISGHEIPNNLNVELPDLASRLQWATLYQVKELTEEEKLQALIKHAHLIGFELSAEVGRFMLSRLPRKMSFLMQALETLAKQSIEKQRIVTVPFVKDVLEI